MSVSLNKNFIQHGQPIEQPVGPVVEEFIAKSSDNEHFEHPIGPANDCQKNTFEITKELTSPFYKQDRKYFPITRKLMTGDWNGDMSHFSTAKKVLMVVIGSIMSVMTSFVTVPYIALKNAEIKVFNSLSVAGQAIYIVEEKLDQVLNAAKMYQGSPDNHARKLALTSANSDLLQSVKFVNSLIPEAKIDFEQLIREKIESDLGSLVISLKPQSLQDAHRFTIPLASLVLDGFYPNIDGAPNPQVKGVRADCITYQFEDGLMVLSKNRILDLFFTESKIDPLKAFKELTKNLQQIQKPGKGEAEHLRHAIREEIWEKLSNPTSVEFQDFQTAYRNIYLQDKESSNEIADQELNQFASSLVKAGVLPQSQAAVFIAQVGGDCTDAVIWKNEEGTVEPNLSAAMAVSMGIVTALECLGFGPISHLNKIFGGKLDNLVNIHAHIWGLAASGLYALYTNAQSKPVPLKSPGNEAVKAFASACQTKNRALNAIGSMEKEFELLSSLDKEMLQKLHQQTEALIIQAGEAFEVVAKSPTFDLIEYASKISAKAQETAEQFASHAESLQYFLSEGMLAKDKVENLSEKSMKTVESDLSENLEDVVTMDEGSPPENRWNKKQEELQKSLLKKMEEVAAFDSQGLGKVRQSLLEIEQLDKEIKELIERNAANPSAVPNFMAEQESLQLSKAIHEKNVKYAQDKLELLSREIAHLRKLCQEE